MECRCVEALGGDGCERSPRALVAADAGDGFSVALGIDGHALGWGGAFYGELGDESGDNRELRQLALPARCVQVACGRNHVLAVVEGGEVFAWGWNRFRQVGEMTDAVKVPTPVQVPLDGVAPIQSVAAGGMHSIAVGADGQVWTWGCSKYGQLGREPVNAIDDCCGTPGRVALPTGAVAKSAAAGWAHSALVLTDGLVFTFGWGLYHQLGHGTTQDERVPLAVNALEGLNSAGGRIVDVACGTWHTAARTASGDAYTWGWGPDGQLGHADGVTSQPLPRVVDLPAVAGYGDEAQELVSLACGARFTIGVRRNGSAIWCGLHTGTSTDKRWVEVEALRGLRVERIAAGAAHAIALFKPAATQQTLATII